MLMMMRCGGNSSVVVVLLHRWQLAKVLLGLNRWAVKDVGGGRGGNSSGTRITATSLQQQILMLLLMLLMVVVLLVPDDSRRHFRLFRLFWRISGRAAALGRVGHIGGEVLAQAVPHVLRSGDGGGGGGDLAVFGAAVLLQMAPCWQGLPALGAG